MEVNGYSNYLIFRNGAVLSKGSKFHKPRFLKHCFNTVGYKVVNLRDGKGGGRPQFIHRLLAEAYIQNPENKPFVDHRDICKTNNALYNLRWVTSKENNNNMPERSLNKNSTTGHKYITKTKYKNGTIYYQFTLQKNNHKHKKRFKTLDEAVKYKNEYLNA